MSETVTEQEYYYGEQTLNAISNFGRARMERDFIRAYGEVKKAAILAVNEGDGEHFDEQTISALTAALDGVIEGAFDKHFVVPFKQGSAGTSINMNFNEVIAEITNIIYRNEYGSEIKLDPIEDINRFQSTNDIFPTAVTVMVYRHLVEIEELIIELQEVLIGCEERYHDILMAGRTEMQSALPITLGQIFGGWAGAIQRDRWRANKLKERIRTVALGGTAMGTCFFAPQKYVFAAEQGLRRITGLPLCRSQNLVDEISNQDKLAELASGYRLFAQNLDKICSDLLLYTSSLSGELRHPELQEGSTIMAAKSNPVILEYVKGLAMDIEGECDKIARYAKSGQLQLNPYLPFMTECFIKIERNFKRAIPALIEKFINKFEIDREQVERNLAGSQAILNALLPSLGYKMVKSIYRRCCEERPADLKELKALIVEESGLEEREVERVMDPARLTSYLRR